MNLCARSSLRHTNGRGGFNALQVAARRPAALKAIITLCSTDDRYETDIHYIGGCHMAADQVSWAAYMLAFNARPPDPCIVGRDVWRQKWKERMEQTPAYLEEWMRHQTRDGFWEHGSVCEDFAAIECPVLCVSGWADGYKNAVLRLLNGLQVEARGIIGPWSHEYPEVATPGPAVGFLQEAIRWWDQFLLKKDSGILKEPLLRAYIQESLPPSTDYQFRPGRWVGVDNMAHDTLCWQDRRAQPSSTYQVLEFVLESLTLLASSSVSQQPGGGVCDSGHKPDGLLIPSQMHAGMYGGVWCNFGVNGDYAAEQTNDDMLALCFESSAAAAPADFLGFPSASFMVLSGAPFVKTLSFHVCTAWLVAIQPNVLLTAPLPRSFSHCLASPEKDQGALSLRLCDVSPEGASCLVSVGVLNLCHRENHKAPAPIPVSTPFEVKITLDAVGYRLKEGHRWRLAISSSLWPRTWPAPVLPRLRLLGGRLRLPVC